MKVETATILDAIDLLRNGLEQFEQCDKANDMLVIRIAKDALLRCRGVEGLSPTARQQVNAAIDACESALPKIKRHAA